jgi:tape measure domain-containing protein
MSSIRTGIELQDNFSPVLDGIMTSVSEAVSGMEQMQHTMDAGVDTSAIASAASDIDSATAAARELAEALQDIHAPVINLDQPAVPRSVEAPVRQEVPPQQLANPPPAVDADISTQSPVTVPVTPVVEQPTIDVPDSITVPVTPEVSEQEPIIYDDITVPVTPVVAEQPQLDVPEEVTVPVTPVVENQPDIAVPDGLTVPVMAEVTEQPEIDVPDPITVPVTPVVTAEPDIEIPEPQIPEPDLSGVEQYTNLINLAGAALQQIVSIQERINSQSAEVNVLPDDVQSKIGKVNTEIQQMQAALDFMQNNPLDLDAEAVILQIDRLNTSINQTLQAQKELDEQLQGMTAPSVDVPPVEWQGDLEVFTSTGIERFNAEVQSANAELNTLNQTQRNIEQTASGMDVLPDGAAQDITSLGQRLEWVTQKLQQIQNNRLNFGTDEANAGLEQIRSQLDAAIHAQNDLNTALDSMDASAANAAYLQLSQTVGNTERFIRDNTNEQGQFNQSIQEGVSQADKLMDTIKGAVAAYISVQSIGKALDMSDQLTLTTSRLDMMNDGVQSTAELVNMVYAAAQDARGSFSDMADVVARFGNNAKDAFSSSEEVVAFADLIQKQMTIAGASTQEAANAELQLSQALGSGVLRGDELNSIFEQAPNLIQNIADYLDVPIGQIREMAADGELSADVVKAAIFAAADDINSKFESMPMTWGQIWQSMQNTAIIAFQPVLQRLNEIANSEAFQSFVSGAIEAMATLANIVLEIFGLIGNVGSFIADNWSMISPIVYGVVGALAVYAAYLAVVKGMEIASAAATAIHAVAMSAKIGITAALTGSTMAATAAQMGYNGALYACPIVWVIMMIIALIAIIFAVCNAIAKMTGIATSGFGVMTGGINVVIQFFRNLGLTVANIAIGIGAAIAALASNMMAAFHNAISNVQSWFYNLLSTALSVIEGICAALNKLPFVEFDYSGISAAADSYAAKATEAAGNKEEYQSISAAFSEGFSTFDSFQSGWASDAFKAGAAWGDGIADKVADFSLSDIFGKTNIPKVDDYVSGFSDAIANSGIGNGVNDIAGKTGAIKDSLDITQEDLKYLRDIAEQEAINRYTTAEIHIEQTNNNTINSDMDLDGVVDGLTSAVNEAVDEITEGVHD